MVGGINMKKTILVAIAVAIVGMLISSATSVPVNISDDNLQKVEETQETIDVIDIEDEEQTSLFGWVWLRGLVFNPREDGSRINARAINLHYFEITPQGIHRGVVRLKTVSFRNGIFIKMSEKGLLGNIVHVSGFCHGSIDIQ